MVVVSGRRGMRKSSLVGLCFDPAEGVGFAIFECHRGYGRVVVEIAVFGGGLKLHTLAPGEVLAWGLVGCFCRR